MCTDWLAEDTFVSHNVIKRVWPASQRDALFWSHLRHVTGSNDEDPDRWIVVNYSTEDPKVPVSNQTLDLSLFTILNFGGVKKNLTPKILKDDG